MTRALFMAAYGRFAPGGLASVFSLKFKSDATINFYLARSFSTRSRAIRFYLINLICAAGKPETLHAARVSIRNTYDCMVRDKRRY